MVFTFAIGTSAAGASKSQSTTSAKDFQEKIFFSMEYCVEPACIENTWIWLCDFSRHLLTASPSMKYEFPNTHVQWEITRSVIEKERKMCREKIENIYKYD